MFGDRLRIVRPDRPMPPPQTRRHLAVVAAWRDTEVHPQLEMKKSAGSSTVLTCHQKTADRARPHPWLHRLLEYCIITLSGAIGGSDGTASRHYFSVNQHRHMTPPGHHTTH